MNENDPNQVSPMNLEHSDFLFLSMPVSLSRIFNTSFSFIHQAENIPSHLFHRFFIIVIIVSTDYNFVNNQAS